MDILCLLDIKILWVISNSLYACLFRKCCILVWVDATHQSSTTTSSTPSDPNFSTHKSRRRYQGGPSCVYTWTTHPTAHQTNEARVMLVPCAARALAKTSRLQLSLRVLNFSISRPRSNVNPMVEPIGWLRTLQFVATDACVREDQCVRAPLLRVQLYVGGIDLGSSDDACEKSREIGVMRLKKGLA